jgi:hypothetical protein
MLGIKGIDADCDLFVDRVCRWEGAGVDEVAYDTKTNKPVVKIDEMVCLFLPFPSVLPPPLHPPFILTQING